MKQPNRVKAAMRAGRKGYGHNLSSHRGGRSTFWASSTSILSSPTASTGRSAWTIFEDLCRTAESDDVTTIARVPDIGSSTILRYLDRGIMGILGPHIATKADARQLVQACYFGLLKRAVIRCKPGYDYNAGIAGKASYYAEANEQMLVCALLEDVAALDNLDAILSVPGIDLYSIGPNDLRGRFRSAQKDQRFESVKRVGTASGCPQRARILSTTSSSRCSTSQQEEP